MVPPPHIALTFEEKAVLWAISLTYVFYALGALYVTGPVIGWLLLLLALWRLLVVRPNSRPPSLAGWIWLVTMLVILVGLVIGHLNYNLGIGKLIKSTIGWGKGWALFAVFILAGSCLNIRLGVLARGANIVGIQTALMTPIMVGAAYAGLPPDVFVSPLQKIGGPGPEFFTFRLYGISPDGGFRWSFFAPWAPGAGIAALVLCGLGVWDRDWRWKAAGISGLMLIVLLTKSRLALLGVPVVMSAAYFSASMTKPWVLFMGAGAILALGIGWGVISEAALDAKAAFDGYRSESTLVRANLQAIAKHRFWEAPIWGHGVQDKGTHLVAFMPIGSHHTWNGLLFVKGLVGLIAFAIPLLWSTIALILRAQHSRTALAGLICALGMWVYSFGENLEVLIYLFWPGLLAMGRGMAQPRLPLSNADPDTDQSLR